MDSLAYSIGKRCGILWQSAWVLLLSTKNRNILCKVNSQQTYTLKKLAATHHHTPELNFHWLPKETSSFATVASFPGCLAEGTEPPSTKRLSANVAAEGLE